MRNKRLIILLSVLLSVTLLVLCNSVLFSVRHVSVHCINRETSRYESDILSHAAIKKGTGIFFVDKGKVTRRIESAVTNVRVLNVEKMFPNRICINFAEIVPYLRFAHDDGAGLKTYYISNDMRVMSVMPGADTSINAVDLKVKGDAEKLTGEEVRFADTRVQATLLEIFDGLERLGYYEKVVELFTEIDLSGNFIDMRTRTGLLWRILGADDLAEKLRFALSVYQSDKLDAHTGGTLLVTGPKSATYQP